MRQRRRVGRAAVVLLSLLLVVPAGQAAVARAQPSEDAVAAAFAAALRLYEAVPGPCAPDDMPGGPPRITPGDQGLGIPPAQWRQSAEQGIATFLIQLCGLTSARIALGRTPTGDWGLLRGGPVGPAPVFVLPGEMVVCGGVRGLNLHALPSADAAVLAVFPDGSRVTAVAFVLTEPATVGESADGAGWYRLSAPQDGWAYSEFLFDPDAGGCPPGSIDSPARPAKTAVKPSATPVGDRPAGARSVWRTTGARRRSPRPRGSRAGPWGSARPRTRRGPGGCRPASGSWMRP